MSQATKLQSRRMESVWRERAHRLSRRPHSADAGQEALPVVVLGVGKERYGIDLPDVAEVFPPLQPTPVPGSAAVLSGVINVHGEIRPVIALRRLLGMEPESGAGIETARRGGRVRVILLRKDGREMGLEIDTVEQIRLITPEEMGPGDFAAVASGESGPSPRSAAHISAHIKGTTKDLLMLLSTDALFAELTFANSHKGVTP
jgi:chemotaxis signal transduction protein